MGRTSHYEEHKAAVLASIEKLTRQEGRAPSIRQVALDVDVSVATLHAYLTKLRDEGLIDWIERTHRSLRVRPQGQQAPVTSPASTGPAVPQPQRKPATPPAVKIAVDPSIDVGF